MVDIQGDGASLREPVEIEVIQAICGDTHLRCSYPDCSCAHAPAGAKRVLAVIRRTMPAPVQPGEYWFVGGQILSAGERETLQNLRKDGSSKPESTTPMDEDVKLIGEARDHASRMHPASHLGGILTRLASRLEALSGTDRQLAAMAEALEPFGDVSGEGDEDFADDTAVVVRFGRTAHHALKLGDFRAAARALAMREGNR
jgi:hypothetical protein